MKLLLGLLVVGQIMAVDTLAWAESDAGAPAEAIAPEESAAPEAEGGDEEGFVDVFDLHEKRLQEEAERAQEEARRAEALAEKQKEQASQKKKTETPRLRVLGSVALGLGGSALVAGAVTGALALSADDEIKKNCPSGDCEPKYHGDLDKRNALALSTDILLGVGGGVAAAGALMIIFSYDWAKAKTETKGPETKKPDNARAAGAENLSLRPVVGPTLVGAVMEWRF